MCGGRIEKEVKRKIGVFFQNIGWGIFGILIFFLEKLWCIKKNC